MTDGIICYPDLRPKDRDRVEQLVQLLTFRTRSGHLRWDCSTPTYRLTGPQGELSLRQEGAEWRLSISNEYGDVLTTATGGTEICHVADLVNAVEIANQSREIKVQQAINKWMADLG